VAFEPGYLALLGSGELERRVAEAWHRLERCGICPRRCGVNRRQTPEGAVCRTGPLARVASYGPHFGEEAPLVGRHGSGTVFFSWCNLKCQYCQNADISQLGAGRELEPEELAAMMLQLQEMGCHNINLVSPSHVVPHILAALLQAASSGLRLPLVYNTGGYDALETLQLLDGVIDIYMPDMKYADEAVGQRLSKVANYPEVNEAAVLEMQRQVGELQCSNEGIARRGLLVRHLVLPHGLAGSEVVFRFLAEQVSPRTYLNVMDQYRPRHHAADIAELSRRITGEEYLAALRAARAAGLSRLDQRAPRAFF